VKTCDHCNKPGQPSFYNMTLCPACKRKRDQRIKAELVKEQERLLSTSRCWA